MRAGSPPLRDSRDRALRKRAGFEVAGFLYYRELRNQFFSRTIRGVPFSAPAPPPRFFENVPWRKPTIVDAPQQALGSLLSKLITRTRRFMIGTP